MRLPRIIDRALGCRTLGPWLYMLADLARRSRR